MGVMEMRAGSGHPRRLGYSRRCSSGTVCGCRFPAGCRSPTPRKAAEVSSGADAAPRIDQPASMSSRLRPAGRRYGLPRPKKCSGPTAADSAGGSLHPRGLDDPGVVDARGVPHPGCSTMLGARARSPARRDARASDRRARQPLPVGGAGTGVPRGQDLAPDRFRRVRGAPPLLGGDARSPVGAGRPI